MKTARFFRWALVPAMLILLAGCDQPDQPRGGAAEIESGSEAPRSTANQIPSLAPPPNAEPPLTDLSRITGSAEPKEFAERAVRLSGVRIQRVLNERFIFVGDETRMIPARLKENHPGIKVGQSIDINGILTLLGEDVHQWKDVSGDERQQLAPYSVFINSFNEKLSTRE